MSIADLLERARFRIEDPSQWTRRAYARTASGVEVIGHLDKVVQREDFKRATCWCAIGALAAEVTDVDDVHAAAILLMEAIRSRGIHTGYSARDVVEYNDTHTHEEMLRMFDWAIKLAKERGI